METNPWNPEGTGIPRPQQKAFLVERFKERDAEFVKKYPLLCSVPSQELFIQAMQSGIPGSNTVQLSEEIMTLATSYVQIETELFQNKNDYDALIEKYQELKDANSKLDRQKRAAGSASSQLQQQNANLQQQVSTLQQNNGHPVHRSAEHPDPELFSADDPKQRKDLPLFIRKVNMKLSTNADWYPSEQSKIVYLISRLRGKAYSTIAYRINRDGTVQFPFTDAILILLEQSFSDVDEINAARREILTIKQGHKDTATHIIDWFEIAQRTGLSDNALINHLYDSLHPEITTQIRNRVMLRQNMPTDLTSYLVEVRHIDAVLRSSNLNYTKIKPVSGTYLSSTLPSSATPTIPIGEPMDLGSATTIPKTTWTAADAASHRIPRTETEKCAKRAYCFENKLCSWCYDPGHRARVCAEARWNKDKPRNADKKTVVEEGKA